MTDILLAMETVYLVLLIASFIGIGSMSVFLAVKLFAGQR